MCHGRTATGRPCKRMSYRSGWCSIHFQERREEFARHSATLCARGNAVDLEWCPNPRAGNDRLCQPCRDAQLERERDYAARVEVARREQYAREDVENRAFAEFQGAAHAWWPAFERWLDDRYAERRD